MEKNLKIIPTVSTKNIPYNFMMLAILLLPSCNQKLKETMKAPDAKQEPYLLSAHNDIRIDPYYWMKDRKDPAVKAYLEAENHYTDHVLKPTKALQEELYREITNRIVRDEETVPYHKNGYWYFTKYQGDSEYPLYCRKRSFEEQKYAVFLNINTMAAGYTYYDDSYFYISPNNNIVAFGEDTISRRLYNIRFKDISSEEMLFDVIPGTTGSVAWASDNKTVFYTLKDPVTLRAYKVMSHQLGDDVKNDKIIFEEQDETFDVNVYNSKSGRFIIISSNSTLTSEVRILGSSNPWGNFLVFEKRKRGHEYKIAEGAERFFIISNLNGKNFSVFTTPFNKTGKAHWKELIPHNDDILIEDLTVFNNHLVTDERHNGLSRLKIMELSTMHTHILGINEPAYVVNAFQNHDLNTDDLRFFYSSLTTPPSVYNYNMVLRKKTLLKEKEIPGGYNSDNYSTERIFATAADGTAIPISLVYKKGIKRDGTNPLLLYGYGSYGYSIDPYFNIPVISLLDRGFFYAIAHIRGGEEMGRAWYEDGKMLNKKKTFHDFIDCSEHLIKEGYSSSDRLFAMGGSAGGLLIGAVVNMRPELYKAVIAAVPFVDVVTTMLDETIPLTTGEYDEWGNPNNKTYYDYMLSYSPYDNVKEQAYPHMLITTGLHDSQVQYWEPAKWTAKLRDMNQSDNYILLHTNMDFGHGGASGRFKRYEERAMEYAFLLWLAGK